MLELTINGEVYEFNFGMLFLKEMNAKYTAPVQGLPGVTKNIGLNIAIANILDGDLEALADVLDTANKGRKPRATRALIESYIEDDSTDIDKLFEDVINFFEQSNCCRKATKNLKEEMDKARAKAAIQEELEMAQLEEKKKRLTS